MGVYYVNEKARYGGVTGTIIPYTIKMPVTNGPDVGDWKEFLPAGFLRCNGQILKKSQYPVLAEVLGTGEDSKFKKEGTTLTSDEFQLPDLGSKFISGGNASGTYLNDRVLKDDLNLYRVGCEIDVVSLVGDTETITYDGTFKVVNPGEIAFIGNPTYSTTQSTGGTLNGQLTDQNFQSHGHNATIGVFSYLAQWSDSTFIDNNGRSRGASDAQTEGSNNLVPVDAPTESTATVSHYHLIDFPTASEIKSGNSLYFTIDSGDGTAGDFSVEAFGLKTEVTLTTQNINKLDEATPPYILVEYLIKI